MNIEKKVIEDNQYKDYLFKRVDTVMQSIICNEGGNHHPHIIEELFNTYNEIFEVKEYARACGDCRKRVFSGLKEWWDNNGGKNNFPPPKQTVKVRKIRK
jgi:hypothetical protein